MPPITTSYLICSTPRSGSTLLCEALTTRGLPAAPRSTSSTAARPACRGGRPSTSRTPRRRDLAILGTYTRVDDEEPVSIRAGSRLPRLPRVDDRPGHHAQRRVRREGHVGLLQRLRRRPPRRARQRRSAARRCSSSASPTSLRLGDPRGQGRPGDLAVEGDPELDLEARRRRRLAARHDCATASTPIDHLVEQLRARRARVAGRFFERAASAPHRRLRAVRERYEETALDILAYLGVECPAGTFGQRRMTRQADELSRDCGSSGTAGAAAAEAVAAPAVISRSTDAGVTPPNILYLHSHDTGRFVQPYGYAIPTPRIQGLAEQGVLFRQAFCAAPTCSASRACLLTGQYAHSNGMLGLAHRGWSLNDYSHHIVHTLRGRRLPLGADRRAAHLQAARRDRLRPVIKIDTTASTTSRR